MTAPGRGASPTGVAIAGIVLAAGAGKRMGGRPKALLTFEGETFLERICNACLDAGCSPLWIVAPPTPLGIPDLAESLGASVVVNPDPERGMFSSAQMGLRAALTARPPVDAAVVFAVDHPAVRAVTVAALIDAFAANTGDEPGRGDSPRPSERAAAGGAAGGGSAPDAIAAPAWFRPVHGGRGGHPVLITRAAARLLIDRAPHEPLRDALRSLGVEPHDVPVDDPGTLANVNTPADLEALLAPEASGPDLDPEDPSHRHPRTSEETE